MEELALEVPINNLSFGNVSTNILLELYKRGYQPHIFPIGGRVDLSAFNDKLTEDFKFWLDSNIKKVCKTFNRGIPTLKLWHIRPESLASYSRKQILYTFYELNKPTDIERNIVRNNDAVIFSSNYSLSMFGGSDVNNIHCVPICFDSNSFFETNKKYLPEDIIVFTLGGKLEKRKHTLRILNLWARLFGNNRKFALNCAIFNPFMKQEHQEHLLNNALGGKKFFNINFLPHMQSNTAYNDFLNAGDIDLTGLSGAEGWNLPAFQSVALGKWSIVLNAHAHKDWANANNSILVEPNGMESAADGIFFSEGSDFNQGEIFTWDESEVIKAIQTAVNNKGKKNIEGTKLKSQFSSEKFVDGLLNVYKEVLNK